MSASSQHSTGPKSQGGMQAWKLEMGALARMDAAARARGMEWDVGGEEEAGE